MDFDDIFENRHKHHGGSRSQTHHDDDNNPHNSHHSNFEEDHNYRWSDTLEKIRSNKKLTQLVRIAFFFFLVITIILVIVLIPYIIKLIAYISQNGLQGLLDSISGFFEKLWNGSVK